MRVDQRALGRKGYDCETPHIGVSGGREDQDWRVERRERLKRSELNGSRPGRSNDELTETTELVLEIACPCTPGGRKLSLNCHFDGPNNN